MNFDKMLYNYSTMKILDAILNIVFPPKCLFCGKDGVLCNKCIFECRPAERENLEWIFSVYDYRDPKIKKIVWLLKYKNRKILSEVIAQSIYSIMLPTLSEFYSIENFRNPYIIPIPLSRERLKERGYNQTKLITEELCKLDKNSNFEPVYNVLIKTKETEHQARIKDKSARMKNLVDTFTVTDEKLIRGKNIILIDDVTTTGATLAEAKKTLKKFGARKVIAFTFAH